MICPKLLALASLFALSLAGSNVLAQGVQPYPNAITDRTVRQATPMSPPPVNVVFQDPDFGSQMVRVTDETTDKVPGGYLRSPAVGATNTWSTDDSKFYVIGEGGHDLAFGFNPSTMKLRSLQANGKALVLPFRPAPMFSFVDPDLMYGTTDANRFTISSYRFSTNTLTPVIDTTTCGLEPALVVTNKSIQSDDDVSLSTDDVRIAISEGGPEAGEHPFVVVYDKNLGCRWYNTQTGQIGGQWGPTGSAPAQGFLINHARITGDGKHVMIGALSFGTYFWDIETLTVDSCPLHSKLDCGGYETVGRSTLINAAGTIDEMNIVKRPLSDLSAISPLVWPLPTPHSWEQEKHFTWTNGFLDDNNPVCASVYDYDGDTEIVRPWDDEIVCIETDLAASTVWRFAHHRTSKTAAYIDSQPMGNVSPDGRFFLFTSIWDGQLGVESNGTTRSDMWIVKLK